MDLNVNASANINITPPTSDGILFIGTAINGPVLEPFFIKDKTEALRLLGRVVIGLTLLKGDYTEDDKIEFVFPPRDFIYTGMVIYKDGEILDAKDYNFTGDSISVDVEDEDKTFTADIYEVSGTLYSYIIKAFDQGATAISALRLNGKHAEVQVGTYLKFKAIGGGNQYNDISIIVNADSLQIAYPVGLGYAEKKYEFSKYRKLHEIIRDINLDAQMSLSGVFVESTRSLDEVLTYFSPLVGDEFLLAGGEDNLEMAVSDQYYKLEEVYQNLEVVYENYNTICLAGIYLDSIPEKEENVLLGIDGALTPYFKWNYNSYPQIHNNENYMRFTEGTWSNNLILTEDLYQRFFYVNAFRNFKLKWVWVTPDKEVKVKVKFRLKTNLIEELVQWETTLAQEDGNLDADVLKEVLDNENISLIDPENAYQVNDILVEVVSTNNSIIDLIIEVIASNPYTEPIIFDKTYNSQIFLTGTETVGSWLYTRNLLISTNSPNDEVQVGWDQFHLVSTEAEVWSGGFIPLFRMQETLDILRFNFFPELTDEVGGWVAFSIIPIKDSGANIDWQDEKLTYYLIAGNSVNTGNNKVLTSKNQKESMLVSRFQNDTITWSQKQFVYIKEITGVVWRRRKDETTFTAVVENQILELGDYIKTEAGASCTIVYSLNNIVQLGSLNNHTVNNINYNLNVLKNSLNVWEDLVAAVGENIIKTWSGCVVKFKAYKAKCGIMELRPFWDIKYSYENFAKQLATFCGNSNSRGGNLIGVMGAIDRSKFFGYNRNTEYLEKILNCGFLSAQNLGRDDNSIGRFLVIPAVTEIFSKVNDKISDGVAEVTALVAANIFTIANQTLNCEPTTVENSNDYVSWSSWELDLLQNAGLTPIYIDEDETVKVYLGNTFYFGKSVYNRISAVRILLNIVKEIREEVYGLIGNVNSMEVNKINIENIVGAILDSYLSRSLIKEFNFSVSMNFIEREANVDLNITTIGEVESINTNLLLNVRS